MTVLEDALQRQMSENLKNQSKNNEEFMDLQVEKPKRDFFNKEKGTIFEKSALNVQTGLNTTASMFERSAIFQTETNKENT